MAKRKAAELATTTEQHQVTFQPNQENAMFRFNATASPTARHTTFSKRDFGFFSAGFFFCVLFSFGFLFFFRPDFFSGHASRFSQAIHGHNHGAMRLSQQHLISTPEPIDAHQGLALAASGHLHPATTAHDVLHVSHA